MEKSVKVAISNRHVHLTKEIYDQLFDDDYSYCSSVSDL